MNKNKLLLITVVICAATLRIGYGWELYLWLDEVQSVLLFVQNGLSQMLRTYSQEVVADVHPPLYYILLTIWAYLFPSVLGMRMLSILFGLCAIVCIYLVGTEVGNEKIGFLSSICLTFSVPHIIYSVEIRMYSLTVLLALLSVFSFLKWLPQKKFWWACLYVISTVLCLYTYHFLVFIILVQHFYVFCFYIREKATLFTWILIHLVLMILYIPGILRLIKQLDFVSHDLWWLSPHILELPGFLLWLVCGPFWRGNIILQILVATTWLAIFALGWFNNRLSLKVKFFLLLWFCLSPLTIFFLSQKSPLFQPRYFLFVLPVFCIISAAGIDRVLDTKFRLSYLFSLILTGILVIVIAFTTSNRLDMKSVLKCLENNWHPDEAVFHILDHGGAYETYLISRYYRPHHHNEWLVGDASKIMKEVSPVIK
ncbi:hypothetical protein ACFL27_26985, partial [candidate division CSSED10-310 bacterium]